MPFPLLPVALGGIALLLLSSSKDSHAAPSGGGGGASKPPTKPATKPAATKPPATKPKPKPAKPVVKPSGPAAPAKPALTVPPPDVIGRIVAAVASNDPQKMRQEAANLRHEGWVVQATDLENAADVAERAAANAANPDSVPIIPTTIPDLVLPPGAVIPAVSPATLPTLPKPPSVSTPVSTAPSAPVVIPGLPTPAKPPASSSSNAAANLAIDVQKHLATHPAWKEDRALITRYQKQEGLVTDGLYGPKTAETFPKYDLVPKTPYYWPKKGGPAARKNWNAYVAAQAARDPSRAAEWKGVRVAV